MAKKNNFARISAGSQINSRKPPKAKQRRLDFKIAGDTETIIDHCPHLFKIEGAEMIEKVNPIKKISAFFKDFLEFFLSKDYYLQQLKIICFVIKKFTQNLQAILRNFLAFVNDQDNYSFFINTFIKEIILN